MNNWSQWKDILVFSFATESFLLQGKVNRKTNRKKFKAVSCSRGRFGMGFAHSVTEEQLRKVGLFDKE